MSIELFFDWSAVVLYLALIAILAQSLRRAPNQLLWSVFAFAVGMTIFKASEATSEMLELPWIYTVGLLGAMIGDTFTLKFPLQALHERWRQPIFYSAVAVAVGIFALLLANTPIPVAEDGGANIAVHEEVAHSEEEGRHDEGDVHDESEPGHVEPSQQNPYAWLAELYLILISGVISGGYMIWQGIRGSAAWIKVKSIGSGLGLAGCCIAIERGALLLGVGITTGIPLFAEFIGALAPLIVILVILYGRKLQSRSVPPPAPLPAA